ncbi:MAG: hypothetical protein ABWK05_02300 [Pyrobaculum sp.]
MASALDAGIAGSRFIRLLLKQSEVRVDDSTERLYQLLAEMGYFVRRGDRYRRTSKIPPGYASRLIGSVFDDIIVPYLLGDAVKINYEALFAATAMFQGLRTRVANKLPKGGLALVAGWLPCGFSTEISAATGADLVILDQFWEVLALEEERISILPTVLEKQEAAPSALFISFEVGTVKDLSLDKYGKFSFALVCHRGVELDRLKEIAEKTYSAAFSGPLGIFADLLSEALSLGKGIGCGQRGKTVYKDQDVCVTDVS